MFFLFNIFRKIIFLLITPKNLRRGPYVFLNMSGNWIVFLTLRFFSAELKLFMVRFLLSWKSTYESFWNVNYYHQSPKQKCLLHSHAKQVCSFCSAKQAILLSRNNKSDWTTWTFIELTHPYLRNFYLPHLLLCPPLLNYILIKWLKNYVSYKSICSCFHEHTYQVSFFSLFSLNFHIPLSILPFLIPFSLPSSHCLCYSILHPLWGNIVSEELFFP